MYMFNRSRRARLGQMAEAVEAAVTAAERVTQLGGVDIHAWSVRFGRPLGTLMWSARLENQAQLIEINEKTLADPGYMDFISSIDPLFEGEGEDRLAKLISGTPSPEPKKYVAVTEAVMANGKYNEAIAWGTEMQEFVAAESGLTTAFAMSTYGGFADVVWILGADSMTEIDSFDDWRMATTEYHERIHAAAGLFVEGSGRNGLIERLN